MSGAGGYALQPHAVSGHRQHALDDWCVATVEAGRCRGPAELAPAGARFRAVPGPAPLAALDEGVPASELDRADHWYRCRFSAPADGPGRMMLVLDGLATLADVWFNGELLLHSDNMYLSHRVDVTTQLRSDNELVMCFRSLAVWLARRRPRGRWPTRLVTERNLRFVRTTLLGYAPSLGPAIKLVGPWRGVRLVEERYVSIAALCARPRHDGERAHLDVELGCEVLGGGRLEGASVHLAGRAVELRREAHRGGVTLRGSIGEAGLAPWWPHTHGTPARHPARLELDLGSERVGVDLGSFGFCELRLDGDDPDRMQLRVNGEPIFCRGACWTPLDARRLHADEACYRDTLLRARDAGMNMLRVGGTMVYESDAFYRLCDELGILVWQDFMFANLDYPTGDAEFRASCEAEARQFLERTAGRCSVCVLCGSSEVQQQAAMMGLPPESWVDAFFDERLPELCREARPGVPYLVSSPSRGVLPFHTDRGPSHYYGVGAYRRSLEDAALSGVRFASECLAFANVAEPGPEPAELCAPADPGVDWDFMDVTEHYRAQLYGVESSPEALSRTRLTPARLMELVVGRFRGGDSGCHGALVWWLRDREPGAGWGVLDHLGRPKAAYYALKRVCAPRALWFVDAGLNGLRLYAANDRPETLAGELHLELFNTRGVVIERAARSVTLPSCGQLCWSVEELIGYFVDSSHAYRFGPPEHEIVCARWVPSGAPPEARALCSAIHVMSARAARSPSAELALRVTARPGARGAELSVRADRFAESVHVEAAGCECSDNYFHLAPDRPHHFELSRLGDRWPDTVTFTPLNASEAICVPLERLVVQDGIP